MAEFSKNIFIPALSLFLLQIASISLSSYFLCGARNDLYFCIISSILYFLSAFSLFKYYFLPKIKQLRAKKNNKFSSCKDIFAFAFISLVIGFLSFTGISQKVPVHPIPLKTFHFNASVISSIKKQYSTELILKITGTILPGNTQINAYYSGNNTPGTDDRISTTTRLYPVVNQQDSPYKFSLLRRSIYYTCYLYDNNTEITGKALSLKTKIRKKIMSQLEKTYTPKTASMLKALYLGNKNYINKMTLYNYKKAGVLHLLAASGLHVGIIVSIPFLLFSLFQINKTIRLLLTLLFLYSYLYITDLPVSLLRATIMFSIYAIETICGFHKNIFNTLLLTAIFLLALFPYELYSMGFQLSFMATLGIISLYKKYRVIFSAFPWKIKNSMAITFSAQTCTIPIIIIHLKEINFSGFLTNLVSIPLLWLQMTVSIINNIAYYISHTFLYFLTGITEYLFLIHDSFIGIIARTGNHFYINSSNSVYLYILVIILITVFFMKHRKKTALLFITVSLVSTWLLFVHNRNSSAKQPAVIKDIASDLIIITIDKEHFLAGSIKKHKHGYNVINMLKQLQIDNISVLITGFDKRSINNYITLIKSCKVNHCYISGTFYFNYAVRNLFSIIEHDGIPMTVINNSYQATNDSFSTIQYGYGLMIYNIYKTVHQVINSDKSKTGQIELLDLSKTTKNY